MTEATGNSSARHGALQGVRVVELAGDSVAFAGKLLGDMGADVILVEPPGGDPARGYPPFVDDEPGEDRSLYWWHYHTSKRGVVIDLDDQAGRDRFRALIATADVLLEGEPRERLGALGIDYEDLKSIRGDLVHVAVTPYGRANPKSDLPFTDLTLMAAGGPPWSCGYDDHSLPPIRGPLQGFHIACHFAVMSTLTALLHRAISGTGQFIDVSMTAAGNVTTEGASYNWLIARNTVQRQTGRHASVQPSVETQQLCADGRYANTGVGPRQARGFAALDRWLRELGLDAELPEAVFLEMGANHEGPLDISKIGEDDEITAIFGASRAALRLIASRLPAQEFFIGCQSAGLTAGAVNSPEEAFEDEHFKSHGFQVPVFHEDLGRDVLYPGAPIRLPECPWAISRRAPKLGEHDDEVFAELA
ncbi:MAG: CoA transferase [Gammaproteobacteria bacterium]|nr:CoA transferase [Gammaproteobacteria bacterium]